jgi:Sigma-70, region 4
MFDRAACERRVYRLATLLAGNPIAASRVIEAVVDAQPDLANLDSAHMDRLTVLRSREIKPATLVSELVPISLAEGIASLSPQQREAWILARVYRVSEREMSRAMDCSVTAAARHLEQADAAVTKQLGPIAPAAASTLLAYSMTLDVPKFYRVQQQRQRNFRFAIMVIAAGLAALVLAAIAMWWSRPLDGS